MRRVASRGIATLLGLASVALVLPSIMLALDFLAVDYLARHTPGEWLGSLWTALMALPSPEQLPVWSLGALAVMIAAVCAMVWLPWLLPCLVLFTGIASVAYIAWTVGVADIGTDPVLWLSLAGTGLGAWNLIRRA